MARLPTAAALAILLLTAGVAGVVSAEPNSTDAKPNPTDANVTAATDRASDVIVVDALTDRRHDVALDDDAPFEQQLARRLAQFDLTDAQVREIVTEASRLRDDGASRLVIRSSIVTNLYEFGVDAPFLYADPDDEPHADAHRHFHRLLRSPDVTPEQARELHAMAHRMLEDGATREEVEQAIRRQVAAWNDDGADYDSIDRLVESISDRYDLGHRQTVHLERLIRGMAEDGADRTEIHRAVSRLLDS
jgi:hypothetical protein